MFGEIMNLTDIRGAFVTGGAGFIGSHIVDRLAQTATSITIYDNFSAGQEQFISHHAENPKIRVVRADVLDSERLKNEMVGCDCVFHFQANADVRGGTMRTRIDLDQNTIATWNVLEAMRINEIKHIVFASSATVYGEPDIFPTPETYAPIQTSLYGASKLACEAMIQAYAEYFGIRCYIFRFVSWIGERYSHGVLFDFVKKT
jgi:UDP-glucose 4-epimerase